MTFKNSVEYVYYILMTRWEKTAPEDRYLGYLDGEPARNTQVNRLAYIIRKLAAGEEDKIYQHISRYSRRNDGKSYISRDSSWMIEPCFLSEGWFFEGCTNLKQKQEIIQSLTKLNFSPYFVACIDDFIEGKSINKFNPSDEEAEAILRRSIELERLQNPED